MSGIPLGPAIVAALEDFLEKFLQTLDIAGGHDIITLSGCRYTSKRGLEHRTANLQFGAGAKDSLMIRKRTTSLLVCALAFCAAPALAGPLPLGPLATAPGVYVDGSSNVWHGSTPYANSFGLSGFVDWAVWAPGTFPAFSGYTPTAGEYIYTYQAAEEGTASLSSLAVTLENAAGFIGEFSGDTGFGLVDGIPADFMQILPLDQAEWYWFTGIPEDSRSKGLAFSSPNPPMLSDGTVIDHGTFAFVIPVPSPGGPVIPEPSTLVLAACGLSLLVIRWLRVRRCGTC